MPSHIAGPVTPVVAWAKNVSHRNAPGAMSAIAFIVSPVKPNVGFISTGASAILSFFSLELCRKQLDPRNLYPLLKLGADWPEKPSWSWQEVARSKPVRILFSPDVAAVPRNLMTAWSQNMKPASRTPRGWLTFMPAGPKTSPGVELVA